MFTALLCRRPSTAVTWYSPGRADCSAPQPGDEVFSFHETRSTPGLLAVSTEGWDARPCGQSAELQMGLSAATTTATNLVPMLNRQDCLPVVTARTMNRGVLPVWYQYCGEERSSVTVPGAQAAAVPESVAPLVLRCRAGSRRAGARRDGVGLGCGDGDWAGAAWCLCV